MGKERVLFFVAFPREDVSEGSGYGNRKGWQKDSTFKLKKSH